MRWGAFGNRTRQLLLNAQYILKARIRGESIRYVKHNSREAGAFTGLSKKFARRLIRRGYRVAFLQPLFDSVNYNSRWEYLLPRASAQRRTQPQTTDGPAVLASLGDHVAVHATSGRHGCATR